MTYTLYSQQDIITSHPRGNIVTATTNYYKQNLLIPKAISHFNRRKRPSILYDLGLFCPPGALYFSQEIMASYASVATIIAQLKKSSVNGTTPGFAHP